MLVVRYPVKLPAKASSCTREAARIQSFDDKFIFYGNKVDIRTQIGNAVPPLMAKAIADQIYISFTDEESEDTGNE